MIERLSGYECIDTIDQLESVLLIDSLVGTNLKTKYPEFSAACLQANEALKNEVERVTFVKDPLEIAISFSCGEIPRVGARISNDIGSPIVVPNFGELTGAFPWLKELTDLGIDHPYRKVINNQVFIQSSALYLPHNQYYIRKHFERKGIVIIKGRSNLPTSVSNNTLAA